MRRALIIGAGLLLPSVTLAAQFAPSSLFLSKESVTEGDSVMIHAVVQNNSTSTFPGQVLIKDGEEKVGSVEVSLAVGEVRAVSVSWKPAAGSHTIVAELLDNAGEVAQSQSARFTIKAIPKPAATSSVASSEVESSQGIQDAISNLSPTVGNAVAPAFRMVDGGRESIASALDTQLSKVKPKLTPTPGVVAGAQTIQAPEQGSWFWSIVNTVYFYILTVLRYLVGSAGVFYPVVAALFFFVLWRAFRRFRRA